MDDFLASCPFPLALVSEEGIVLRCNSAWSETVEVVDGEPLTLHLQLSDKHEKRTIEDVLEESMNVGCAKPFALKGKALQVVLAPGREETKNCFWARINTGDLDESYYSLLANERRLGDMAEMTAGIAHEVSNPLTIIAAKTTIMKVHLKGLTDQLGVKEALACGDQVLVQCQRITKIIKAMRTFARDAGSDPVTPADVQHLVEESRALCSEQARVRGVEFQFDVPPVGLVNCRPVEATQILYNLFTNAIDATDSIPSPIIKVSYRQSEEFIEILVSDNGPGVPPDLVKKIFNPFFTTKEVGHGTGLGLSLSLRMSRRIGGDLYLDRAHGSSCFVLRLLRTYTQKENIYDHKVG